MPVSLAGEVAAAAAVGEGTAVTAVGVCWTEPGCAPGRVLVEAPGVVVVVSADAGPEEKATSPKMATAPTRAAGAARRARAGRRGVSVVT